MALSRLVNTFAGQGGAVSNNWALTNPEAIKPGAKMAFFKDGSNMGTVGGGALEAEVEKIAAEIKSSRSNNSGFRKIFIPVFRSFIPARVCLAPNSGLKP